MEGILGAAAVRGRVGQRADGVEHLDHGAGPAVGHDQRQRVLVRRLDVDEVDVHAVDLGRELRQRVQLRLGLAPVVVGRPVARELLHRRQLHALRPIFDELLAGPARRGDAAAQVGERLIGNVEVERTDVGCGLDSCHAHLPVVGSTPSIVGGRRSAASAASFVEAVALRRRGERSNGDTLRVPAASQCCSPGPVQIRLTRAAHRDARGTDFGAAGGTSSRGRRVRPPRFVGVAAAQRRLVAVGWSLVAVDAATSTAAVGRRRRPPKTTAQSANQPQPRARPPTTSESQW